MQLKPINVVMRHKVKDAIEAAGGLMQKEAHVALQQMYLHSVLIHVYSSTSKAT